MVAYTYLVTHKPSGQKYYGSRWAEKADPSDLWVTYFTSSRHVRALIAQDGKDSFSHEVRRVFTDGEQCRRWEKRVLTKLRVWERDGWLNRSNTVAGPCWNKGMPMLPETKEKCSQSSLARFQDPAERKKLSDAKKKLYAQGWMPNLGKKRKDKSKMLAAQRARVAAPGYVPPSLGKKHSEASRQKMRASALRRWQ